MASAGGVAASKAVVVVEAVLCVLRPAVAATEEECESICKADQSIYEECADVCNPPPPPPPPLDSLLSAALAGFVERRKQASAECKSLALVGCIKDCDPSDAVHRQGHTYSLSAVFSFFLSFKLPVRPCVMQAPAAERQVTVEEPATEAGANSLSG
jgi:hypothetical protein